MLSNFVTNCFNVASVEFTGFFFLSKLFWLPAHWTTWLLLGGRINTSKFLEFCTCIRKRIAPFCSKGNIRNSDVLLEIFVISVFLSKNSRKRNGSDLPLFWQEIVRSLQNSWKSNGFQKKFAKLTTLISRENNAKQPSYWKSSKLDICTTKLTTYFGGVQAQSGCQIHIFHLHSFLLPSYNREFVAFSSNLVVDIPVNSRRARVSRAERTQRLESSARFRIQLATQGAWKFPIS